MRRSILDVHGLRRVDAGAVVEIGPYELKVLPSTAKREAPAEAAQEADSGKTRILETGTQTMAPPSAATLSPAKTLLQIGKRQDRGRSPIPFSKNRQRRSVSSYKSRKRRC